MTLTQLSVFVLVARLGSVKAAAEVLGVSEAAVSQSIAALRRHLDQELLVRHAHGMTLTDSGQRLFPIASQIAALGVRLESEARTAAGGPELLRLVVSSEIGEFVAPGLVDAFTQRLRDVEVSVGVATTSEMGVLIAEWLADVALGPRLDADPALGIDSVPVMRCQLVAVAAPTRRLRAHTPWLVDPSSTDAASPAAQLLRRRRVPEAQLQVFPSLTASWNAAAEGEGIALGLAHLLLPHLQRDRLRIVRVPGTPVGVEWCVNTVGAARCSPAASAMRSFLATPPAMRLMHRPGHGVPLRRFRPPVYVTIWS